MKHLFRSPRTWVCAIIISVLLCITAFHFFPKAFPLVSVDITMDLHNALTKAHDLAEKNNWGPRCYKSAAQFNTDFVTTTFVELEGGGKDALNTMISQELYAPYTWHVRHFKEFEKNETMIIFTPQGRAYGFIETISENFPGAQLNSEEAEAIAREHATQEWNIDFSPYTRIEASQKKELSNRIDHTFVYERIDATLKEGHYRLVMRVSGDKVTQLTHFVNIPEAFIRRYERMRSANNTIAQTASLIALLLFGGIIVLFFFLRRRWFFWKQPLAWGLFLAGTNTLVSINMLPSLWMYYQTFTSSSSFLLQLAFSWINNFFGQTCIITCSLIAAETLTNRAFKNHPQLWNIWSSSAASSYQIIGRTLGGYLLAAFNIAFVVLFYLISGKLLGWWNPSSPLFDPNILATYAPWFSSVAQAINAAFLEEALFRAIPLAGAALIGTYLGQKNIALIFGVIIQALIFGAAHANYPAQPAYARVVELFIPGIIWGITYIRFGLLPVIITHFIYDVVWMSLPLFISYAPYIGIYKSFVIILSLVPLFVSLYARIKKGTWTELNETDYNSALIESEVSLQKPTITITKKITNFTHKQKITVYTLGIIGLALWLFATPFHHDGVTIKKNRTAAIQQADDFLQKENISLASPWQTLPCFFSHYQSMPSIALQHRFIWNEGNKNIYDKLLGNYLEPAHWTTRYVQFDGDIIAQAEEYRIMLDNENIIRLYHKLPESTPGAQLTQDEARSLIHIALYNRFNVTADTLEEVSAQEIKRPQRKDWLFTFADPAYPIEKGKAYIRVALAGDKIVDAQQLIHVPEEWARHDSNKQNTASLPYKFCLLLYILLVIGILLKTKQSTHHSFSKRSFIILYSILFILSLISTYNMLPALISTFTTSEPFITQILQLITSQCVISLISTGFLAYIMVYTTTLTHTYFVHTNITYILGICIGVCISGTSSLLTAVAPKLLPLWPNYTPLEAYISSYFLIFTQVTHYISTTCLLLFFTSIINRLQTAKNHTIISLIMYVLFGLITTQIYPTNEIGTWAIIGTITGLLLYYIYMLIIHLDSRITIISSATILLLKMLQYAIFNPYQYAFIDAMMTSIVIGLITFIWCKKIEKIPMNE